MIMAMIRPETEMKDSGIEYVGAIPKDWDLVRLRAYFGERKNKNKDGNETNLLSLSYGRIIRKNIDKTDGLLPASFNTYNIVEKNDIIIRPTDLQNDKRSLRTGLVTEHGIITSAYIDLMPIGNVDSRFVHYLLHSYDILKVFYNMGSGVRQGLNYSEFSKLKVPMPPLSEQQAIANYLDETCSKIDEIIAEAKASIDEYTELKQSVIFEAVTKGLDKNVEMKDSGIEWIGRIPKHWSLVKSNRFITSTQNGISRRDLEKSTGNIVLKLRNITEIGEIDYSYTNRIELSNKEFENYILQIGDLLFVRVNGSKALVGKCAIFNGNNEPVAYNDHIIRVQINKFCVGEYFKWYLLSQSGKTEIALHINTSAGQYTISGQGLKDIYVSLPPIHEQENIIMFLGNKCKQIDSLIAEKESLIHDLEAYKKSLIYEVVTGKRRVV